HGAGGAGLRVQLRAHAGVGGGRGGLGGRRRPGGRRSTRRGRGGRGRGRRRRGRRRLAGPRIEDAPEAALLRIGDVHRPVGAEGQPGRAVLRVLGDRELFDAREARREHLVRAARHALVVEGYEGHVVALLRLRRAVPGAVERDEGTAPVLRRELLSGIERHLQRRPVRGEGDEGFGVLARLGALEVVAAVLGRDHARLLDGVVIGVRPAVVGAFAKDV